MGHDLLRILHITTHRLQHVASPTSSSLNVHLALHRGQSGMARLTQTQRRTVLRGLSNVHMPLIDIAPAARCNRRTVSRIRKSFTIAGTAASTAGRLGRPPSISLEMQDALRHLLSGKPDRYLCEMAEMLLRSFGKPVSLPTISRTLKKRMVWTKKLKKKTGRRNSKPTYGISTFTNWQDSRHGNWYSWTSLAAIGSLVIGEEDGRHEESPQCRLPTSIAANASKSFPPTRKTACLWLESTTGRPTLRFLNPLSRHFFPCVDGGQSRALFL